MNNNRHDRIMVFERFWPKWTRLDRFYIALLDLLFLKCKAEVAAIKALLAETESSALA